MNQWLKERNLICEESFGEALYTLAIDYSHENDVSLSSVWDLLGVSKQNINFWKYHDQSSTTHLKLKRNAITNAKIIFQLEESEANELAMKSGIVWDVIRTDAEKEQMYKSLFASKLKSYTGKKRNLYEAAGLSKTSFHYIITGEKIRKEKLISVLILMGSSKTEIQEILNAAGYCLSKSYLVDIVINYLLLQSSSKDNGIRKLNKINDVLYELGLPLI